MILPRRREGFDLNGERLAIRSSRCDKSVINAQCRPDALLGSFFERRAATPEFASQLDIATPLRNKVFRAAPFRRQAVLARRLRCRRRRCVSHEAVYGGIRGLICRPAPRRRSLESNRFVGGDALVDDRRAVRLAPISTATDAGRQRRTRSRSSGAARAAAGFPARGDRRRTGCDRTAPAMRTRISISASSISASRIHAKRAGVSR